MTSTTREELTVVSTTYDSGEATGRICLQPVPGSTNWDTVVLELDLAAADELCFGDLRKAALRVEQLENFEIAHRLWTVVATAAFSLGDLVLSQEADERADRANRQAMSLASVGNRKLAQYDYDSICRARQGGESIAEVAKRLQCSPTTVKRAVRYVNERDRVLGDHPEVVSEIEAGADVSALSKRFGVEQRIMRWIVISHFERRSKDRSESRR